MAKKKAETKRQSYATRTGRTPIQLVPTEAEHDLIRRAAELDHRPKTQFVMLAALAAARKILGENSPNP